MRTTIEKVRAAMVAGAALVAMVVAGFLLLAHYRAHRSLRNLPARLGLDIQKETNGYTVSQSVKGHTVFTLHAAKATQHKDGMTALQDVGVVLYGQKDGRADRIRGKQFEYDQKNGVVRATGEVQLDLQAPAPSTAGARAEYARGGASAGNKAGEGDGQPIHVVTSGLVYVQSLGVASTDQPIRFVYRGMTGQARGAAYNSDTGVTTLESEVRVSAVRDGRPTVLTAAHAEMDRANHRMTLRMARYVALSKVESERGGSETMTAGLMVVHLAQDGGGIESAEGSDGVEVASGESHMQAPEGVVHMNADGRAEMAQMTGGVRFASEQGSGKGAAGDTIEGQAASGVAHFNGRGEVETVRLTGGVKAQSRRVSAGETREMMGGEMDLRLGGNAGGSRRWVQEATMRGDARVTSALPAITGHTAGTEEMRGDVLVGSWREEHGATVLREVTGEGHTAIRRVRDGVDEVSRGDRLRAEFGAVAKAGVASRPGIVTATQEGAVALERVAAVKSADGAKAKTDLANAKTETTRGRAERAEYDAASGQVRLTGGAEISDGASAVRAERVAMSEGTGDAEAQGTVQVTYRQPAAVAGAPSGESHAMTTAGGETHAAHAGEAKLPIHAVAERAVMRKASGVTTFFGTPTLRARLWQGGSQVEAPVLVFGRKDSTLDAYGAEASEAMPVRTVLASAPHATAAADEPAEAKRTAPAVVRVQSGRLHYAEALRRAEFSKGVVLEDAEGTMTSRDAVALLLPNAAKQAVPAGGNDVKTAGTMGVPDGGLPGGGLDRVTATGDVVIRQTGRVATGQQAVYTAKDGMFVLTGGGGVLPKVVDEANGTITGAALRFGSGDDSVTVDGRVKDGAPAAGDGRVHTRTKVKQKG